MCARWLECVGEGWEEGVAAGVEAGMIARWLGCAGPGWEEGVGVGLEALMEAGWSGQNWDQKRCLLIAFSY
jgi:hypothetical protein